MLESILRALLGGVLIGVAVTLMLWLTGRVTGISGILNSALNWPGKGSAWRWAFLGGLVFGGLLLVGWSPGFFTNTTDRSLLETSLAGFLVGFGTILGSGCTSGHGICGISRFSIRSLVATMTFILSGMLATTVFKGLL